MKGTLRMNLNIWDTIARELSGELSEADRTELDAWLSAAPENRASYEEARQAWEMAGELPADEIDTSIRPDIDKAWNKVLASISTTEESSEETKVVPISEGMSKRNRWILRIAAVLMFGLVSTFAFRYMTNGEQVETLAMINVSTTDEVREVTLPDGSQVWLNRNASLSYQDGFKGDTRKVTLNGEAFFEVTKNPDQPFVISTSTSKTTVLGTSFLLKDDGDGESLLVVNSGQVSFGTLNDEQKEIFEKGDRGELAAGNLAKTTNADPNAFSFKTNALDLEGLSLDQAVEAIEDYFNVDVIIEATDLPQDGLHPGAPFQEPELEDVIKTLSLMKGCTYTIDDTHTIRLHH